MEFFESFISPVGWWISFLHSIRVLSAIKLSQITEQHEGQDFSDCDFKVGTVGIYRKVPNKRTCLNKRAPSTLGWNISLKIGKIGQKWANLAEKTPKCSPWTCSIHQGVCQRAGHVYLALYGNLVLTFKQSNKHILILYFHHLLPVKHCFCDWNAGNAQVGNYCHAGKVSLI